MPKPVFKKKGSRIDRMKLLLDKATPFESESNGHVATVSGGDTLSPAPCEGYEELLDCWKQAMEWTDGLESALGCMLASVVSTMQVGSQLWMKIIGPASCGKSTLCEALSVNTQYVLAKSTLRGFHSGYGDGTEDSSLVNACRGKTFITKDGDTLLQAPNYQQILSEARDIYDTVSRTSYRNKASKDYSGLRMTWLLCGTASLRSIDDSELGERFLDCVIMDGIDDELEDRILGMVAKKAVANMGIEFDGTATKQYGPELIRAMQLTGGYVTWLRETGKEQFANLRWSTAALNQCTRLGKFVAYMRARPSKRQEETQEREFGARLVEQHVRLASSLAIVMNKDVIDDEVMKIVKRTALDTGRGPVLDMCHRMYTTMDGLDNRAIQFATGKNTSETGKLCKFLRGIGAIQVNEKAQGGRNNRSNLFQMTAVTRALYRDVMKDLDNA